MPTYPPAPVRERETLLISRATWGWTPATEADVLREGWQVWLDRQLEPSSIDDSAMTRKLTGYTTLTNTSQQNWVLWDADDDDVGRDRVTYELLNATFLRAVHSKRQLFEVMVDFWTNHFSCSLLGSGKYGHLQTADDRSVARTHALGRFADLLLASARSPAMLAYLDNHLNDASRSGALNQNYGRELLELHTLGILDGTPVFSEADVEASTRIMSGWSIDTASSTFSYRAAYHHGGPVSFLGGAWSTPGRTGNAGQQDGVDFLGFLARHRSTARHVCRQLCLRFVSDDPPSALVEQLADVYQANDTAIAPVLRTLFHSDAFASSAGAKVRRGLDVAVATTRIVGGRLTSDTTSDTTRWLLAPWGVLAGLGQQPFGHLAPDGYSDENVDWISNEGLLRRWELAAWAAKGWLGEEYVVEPLDVLPSPAPRTGGTLVDTISRRLSGNVYGSPGHGFSDVPPTAFFDQAVAWMVDHGITTGYADGTFRPMATLNRGQLSTFLHRLVGEPTGSPAADFPDVPPESYFHDAVAWMVAEEITTGYADGTFRPNAAVTRAQVSAFLWRLEGRPGGMPDHGFPDVPTNAFYSEAVSWMVWRGITTGYADGTFRPNRTVNRSQISAFLWRLGFSPEPTLSPAERAALLTFLDRGEDEEVQEWLLWRVGDLTSLVLGFPAFQRR